MRVISSRLIRIWRISDMDKSKKSLMSFLINKFSKNKIKDFKTRYRKNYYFAMDKCALKDCLKFKIESTILLTTNQKNSRCMMG